MEFKKFEKKTPLTSEKFNEITGDIEKNINRELENYFTKKEISEKFTNQIEENKKTMQEISDLKEKQNNVAGNLFALTYKIDENITPKVKSNKASINVLT